MSDKDLPKLAAALERYVRVDFSTACLYFEKIAYRYYQRWPSAVPRPARRCPKDSLGLPIRGRPSPTHEPLSMVRVLRPYGTSMKLTENDVLRLFDVVGVA